MISSAVPSKWVPSPPVSIGWLRRRQHYLRRDTLIGQMAQGFKKFPTRPGAAAPSTAPPKRTAALKRGARVIKPRKAAAVQLQALQKVRPASWRGDPETGAS